MRTRRKAMKKTGFVKERCPKCNGSVYLDSDIYGWFEECLQCGHTSYLESVYENGKSSPVTREALEVIRAK
jgi:hypothetical protein